MSRFYSNIEGQAKTEATRRGSSKSGIYGHIRGWRVGVEVCGFINEDGEDEFRVLLTGGSEGWATRKMIGSYTAKDLKD